MFGIIFTSIGTFFEEISSSIGKKEVCDKKESNHTLAFLTLFWGTFWFLAVILIKGKFGFSPASLPTFLTRVALEIVQIHITITALVKSDRSSFSFVRTGTIPLLLMSDLIMGYDISPLQMAGIGLIIVALLTLFMNHGVSKKGIWWIICSAIGSAITISLYKYNISRYNSVEAEQFLMHSILLIYFFYIAKRIKKENPLLFLKKKIFFFQSFSQGIGSALESFAYLFAPASVLLAAKRSSAVFWSITSGKTCFHEDRILLKLFVFGLMVFGFVLLVLAR